jgi:hypothetical protein
MNVGVLQQFLRSLVPALEGAGAGKTASEVNATLQALEPFQSLDAQAFAAFLIRARDYQAAGSVTAPTPGEQQVGRLAKVLERLHAATDGIPLLQQEAAAALQDVAVQAGLKGKLSADPKWAETRGLLARIAPHRRTIFELSARIISSEAHDDPVVRKGIDQLADKIDPASLKALAAEYAVKFSARTPPAKVVGEILAKLSGFPVPKAKPKSKKGAVDPAVVEENSHRLAAMITRSINPGGTNENEIEAELSRLKALSLPTLFEVVTRVGIGEARPNETKSELLKRVKNELAAARRSRERAEV